MPPGDPGADRGVTPGVVDGLAIVAAVARNGVIGRGNALPWRLPDDLKRFKALTVGHVVVMGRRTWESLGRPLPDRRNVVLSRDPAFAAPGAEVFRGLDEALSHFSKGWKIFVIGGAAVYAAALPRVASMFLTEIEADVEGDVLFPRWDRAAWRVVSDEPHPADAQHAFAFRFVGLERVRSGKAAGVV
jgi:dihydrofolate reductase